MIESTCVTQKICGKIFNDIFSLTCEFCGDDFLELEDFRSHLIDHFPETPTLLKNEDSISLNSVIKLIPAEKQGNVKYIDMRKDDGRRPAAVDLSLSIIVNEVNIKSELEQNQIVVTEVEDVSKGGESEYENGIQTRMSTRRCNAGKAKTAPNVSHRLQCDICQRRFNRKGNIIRHMTTVHINKRSKQCQVYSKSLLLKSIMNLRKHSGENPYKCNDCSRSFLREGHLTRHRKKHTGGQHHKCDVCSKSFSWKTHFMRHMITHTNEKLHKCLVCLKSFSRKTILTDHMRIHLGEKPHKCEVCSKVFSRHFGLTKHLVTHTGERPYKCPFCNKNFMRIYDLSKHFKVHVKHARTN